MTVAGSETVAARTSDSKTAFVEEWAVICARKARLLESYLNSPSAKKIETQGARQAQELVARARERLKSGMPESGATGDCPNLDEGLRLIVSAMTASGLKETDENKHKAGYALRARQLNAYIQALSVSSRRQWPSEIRQQFADAEIRIARAGRLAAEGRYEEAHKTIETAYATVLAILRDLHDGKSILHRLVFETPLEEYQYEVDRNRSYEMLLIIALDESPVSNELTVHVAEVFSINDSMRAEAHNQVEAGAYADAIKTMESASRKLAKTLRLLGVMVWD
ncbi:MAG: hypothetical protein ACE5FO_07505 [Parvularculaceae bacterium]